MSGRYEIEESESIHPDDKNSILIRDNETGKQARICCKKYSRGQITVIRHFLENRGLSDLAAFLTPEISEVEPVPAEPTPKDWAKLNDPLFKPFPPPLFTHEQTQALIELADERIFAKARAAEQDQPERRRTYDEILAENRERFLAGETVIVPERYSGLTWAQTRWIGRTLRQLSTDEPSCGVLHDPYCATDQGAA